MQIKTVVIDYEPKAKKMAKQIEDAANDMEQNGYEFLTFSITGSAKAILVFRDKNQAGLPTPEACDGGNRESREEEIHGQQAEQP